MELHSNSVAFPLVCRSLKWLLYRTFLQSSAFIRFEHSIVCNVTWSWSFRGFSSEKENCRVVHLTHSFHANPKVMLLANRVHNCEDWHWIVIPWSVTLKSFQCVSFAFRAMPETHRIHFHCSKLLQHTQPHHRSLMLFRMLQLSLTDERSCKIERVSLSFPRLLYHAYESLRVVARFL